MMLMLGYSEDDLCSTRDNFIKDGGGLRSCSFAGTTGRRIRSTCMHVLIRLLMGSRRKERQAR